MRPLRKANLDYVTIQKEVSKQRISRSLTNHPCVSINTDNIIIIIIIVIVIIEHSTNKWRAVACNYNDLRLNWKMKQKY